jgi:hypothetical protein
MPTAARARGALDKIAPRLLARTRGLGESKWASDSS